MIWSDTNSTPKKMKNALSKVKDNLISLRNGEVCFFSQEEYDEMISALEGPVEENKRVLDQPSEALLYAVDHLIEVENSTENDDGKWGLDDLNEAWEQVRKVKEEVRASLHWSDKKLRDIIADRIRDEYRKYGKEEVVDWPLSAAAKIVGTTRDVLGGFISLRLIKAGDDCAIALKNLSSTLSKEDHQKAMRLYDQWQIRKSGLSDLTIFYEMRSTKRLCDAARDYLKNPNQNNEEVLRNSIDQVEGKSIS